jgi:hypothetical protein
MIVAGNRLLDIEDVRDGSVAEPGIILERQKMLALRREQPQAVLAEISYGSLVTEVGRRGPHDQLAG